jgi:hypothetical protein
MSEFMAVGNHRPSIAAVIAEVVEKVRGIELNLLTAAFGDDAQPEGPLTLEALMLITGMPKYLNIEAGLVSRLGTARWSRPSSDTLMAWRLDYIVVIGVSCRGSALALRLPHSRSVPNPPASVAFGYGARKRTLGTTA